MIKYFNPILIITMATARFSSAFIVSRNIRCSRRLFASVSGTAYKSDDGDAPVVRLFTKEGSYL